MKKLLLTLGATALILGLGACNNSKKAKSEDKSVPEATSKTASSDDVVSEAGGSGGEGSDKIYLDLGTSKTYWETKENPVIYAYFYTPEAVAWPGTAMSVGTSGYYEIDYVEAANIIFNVNGWGGDCQTVDLDIPTDGKNLFTINTSYTDGTNQNGTWSAYTPSN